MSLRIKDEDEVNLEGYFIGDELKFRYGTEELADYGDSVEAFHHREVRFTLQSPVGATLRASHDEGRQTVTWTPIGGGVANTFAAGMTDPAEVEAEAAPKPAKRIFIQVKQTGGLPDS